jgi:hypothetical protein
MNRIGGNDSNEQHNKYSFSNDCTHDFSGLFPVQTL